MAIRDLNLANYLSAQYCSAVCSLPLAEPNGLLTCSMTHLVVILIWFDSLLQIVSVSTRQRSTPDFEYCSRVLYLR